jgi:pyruvate dehydrogenase E2 component (dihydrolipoamide acetyltransferase)
VDDAIATLESDKATMDVPSSAAGVVKEVLINLGDKVSEGTVLIKVEAAGAAAAAAPARLRPCARSRLPRPLHLQRAYSCRQPPPPVAAWSR